MQRAVVPVSRSTQPIVRKSASESKYKHGPGREGVGAAAEAGQGNSLQEVVRTDY